MVHFIYSLKFVLSDDIGTEDAGTIKTMWPINTGTYLYFLGFYLKQKLHTHTHTHMKITSRAVVNSIILERNKKCTK